MPFTFCYTMLQSYSYQKRVSSVFMGQVTLKDFYVPQKKLLKVELKRLELLL